MPLKAILREVEKLHDVSERLVALAEKHPRVAEALMAISGNVRSAATILGVLVATRLAASHDSDSP
jgi:hypothetical protein